MAMFMNNSNAWHRDTTIFHALRKVQDWLIELQGPGYYRQESLLGIIYYKKKCAPLIPSHCMIAVIERRLLRFVMKANFII